MNIYIYIFIYHIIVINEKRGNWGHLILPKITPVPSTARFDLHRGSITWSSWATAKSPQISEEHIQAGATYDKLYGVVGSYRGQFFVDP